MVANHWLSRVYFEISKFLVSLHYYGSPLCVARKLITVYFAGNTTLTNKLYPMVMTGLVNGVGIIGPMVMEEILNRDIQRRVIETKHVYFRPTAIIRCPEKCDNNRKQNYRDIHMFPMIFI